MAHAYTPGLRVSEMTVLRKERLLPIKGDVIVSKGDRVSSDTIVARRSSPLHSPISDSTSTLDRYFKPPMKRRDTRLKMTYILSACLLRRLVIKPWCHS